MENSVYEGLIKVTNPRTDNVAKTYLIATKFRGQDLINVRNVTGFGSDWGIQIGETGQEASEVVVIDGTAPVGTILSFVDEDTLARDHAVDTPVYGIKWNEVVFEKSTAGTTGTATPITGGTVRISPDSPYTSFDDANWATDHAYRTRFQNLTLGSTAQSAWFTSSDFAFYSLASMRDRAKAKLWDSSYVKGTAELNDWINEWKDKMSNAVISVNEDYALGTVEVGFGTDGFGTVDTLDLSQLRRVWITYNGVDKYASTKQNINDFLPGDSFSNTHPYHAWKGDNILSINPADQGGTAELVYYQFGTTMVNDTDVLPLPMRSYTTSFVDYALAQALFKDGKINEYDRKMNEVRADKDDFVKNLSPRDKSGPTYIKTVEPTSGEGGLLP